MRIRIVLASLVLALTACAPDTGKVYDRQYYPAYVWTDMVCASYDTKTGKCTMRVPQTHYYPAQWLLCLDNGEDRGCKSVDERTYHEYPPGSDFNG